MMPQVELVLAEEPVEALVTVGLVALLLEGPLVQLLETKAKKEDLKLWLSISNQRNVPHSLLLYTRINDFCNDIFEIKEDEDD